MTQRKTGPDKATVHIVQERAQGVCERCGHQPGAETQHRKPRGMGGTSLPSTNYPSNLVWLCRPCHRHVEVVDRKGAYPAGWLVPRTQDPTQWPVKHAQFGWVFLRDDGGWDPAPVEEHTAGCTVWGSDDPCDCGASNDNGSVEPQPKEAS